jgi:hypothetical protein
MYLIMVFTCNNTFLMTSEIASFQVIVDNSYILDKHFLPISIRLFYYSFARVRCIFYIQLCYHNSNISNIFIILCFVISFFKCISKGKISNFDKNLIYHFFFYGFIT